MPERLVATPGRLLVHRRVDGHPGGLRSQRPAVARLGEQALSFGVAVQYAADDHSRGWVRGFTHVLLLTVSYANKERSGAPG